MLFRSGSGAHCGSAQSVSPSQSLSIPSVHTPGRGDCNGSSGVRGPQSGQLHGFSPRLASQTPLKLHNGLAQAPLTHDKPAAQTAPHAPQLFGSFARSAQAPGQHTFPGGQAQSTAQVAQVSVGAQTPSPQQAAGQAGSPQQPGSSQSISPLQSLSIPSAQPGPNGPGNGSGRRGPQSGQLHGFSPAGGPSQRPSPQQAGIGVNTQPVSGSHVSVVHGLLSLHGGIGVNTQPVSGTHVSVVQALLSLQTSAGPPTHVPLEHVSLVVQSLPSLQAVDVVAVTIAV